jgi:uncharacterized membrane protein YedE/YeeE
MSLVYGLITGILFGVLLQRAEVLRFGRQVGALRLLDMTIFKFMLSAILVGAVGIYLLKDLGWISLSLKGTSIGAQVLGGILFGIGWAVLGYCPGTAGGALAEGRTDAALGLAGMLAGGALYAWAYPLLKSTVIPLGDMGKITVPGVLGVSHWLVILVFAAGVLGFFRLVEKKGL